MLYGLYLLPKARNLVPLFLIQNVATGNNCSNRMLKNELQRSILIQVEFSTWEIVR